MSDLSARRMTDSRHALGRSRPCSCRGSLLQPAVYTYLWVRLRRSKAMLVHSRVTQLLDRRLQSGTCETAFFTASAAIASVMCNSDRSAHWVVASPTVDHFRPLGQFPEAWLTNGRTGFSVAVAATWTTKVRLLASIARIWLTLVLRKFLERPERYFDYQSRYGRNNPQRPVCRKSDPERAQSTGSPAEDLGLNEQRYTVSAPDPVGSSTFRAC